MSQVMNVCREGRELLELSVTKLCVKLRDQQLPELVIIHRLTQQ